MRRIVQQPRVLPPVTGFRPNAGVRWAPRGPAYGRVYRPGLRGYDDVAGLEGWGKIMEKVRKTVKAPVRLVQKAIKPVMKMLPTPVRKLIAIPGKIGTKVAQGVEKVGATIDKKVLAIPAAMVGLKKAPSGGGGGGSELVYTDADGKPISKAEYDRLAAEAAKAPEQQYTDENGKPISKEEYDRRMAEYEAAMKAANEPQPPAPELPPAAEPPVEQPPAPEQAPLVVSAPKPPVAPPPVQWQLPGMPPPPMMYAGGSPAGAALESAGQTAASIPRVPTQVSYTGQPSGGESYEAPPASSYEDSPGGEAPVASSGPSPEAEMQTEEEALATPATPAMSFAAPAPRKGKGLTIGLIAGGVVATGLVIWLLTRRK